MFLTILLTIIISGMIGLVPINLKYRNLHFTERTQFYYKFKVDNLTKIININLDT